MCSPRNFSAVFVPYADMKYNEEQKMAILEKCVSFLNEVGIHTSFKSLTTDTFLPGFHIENGTIIIDKSMLKHPGDILHEAGHIAVVSSANRRRLTEKSIIKSRDREAEEVMAIAWSYAACLYLNIDPVFVFHEDGYRDGSSSIIESCEKNEYIGMFMLQSIGMAVDRKHKKYEGTSHIHMTKWLRE